ncbi:ABC transporter permease subunit [Halomicroarcula sp. GCM10025709]|uniref:ABC transporter permease subunit n=1 Tax=Halomicroarcula sp. GCM10025709 TaxID=3252669 RepID=UPI00360A55C8
MRFKGLFRTTIALPVAANLVAYATVFLLLLQDNGLVNTVFQMLGLPTVPWLSGGTELIPGPLKSVLGTGFWPRISLVGAVTWRWTGYNMIILLAGLQSVPQQLYEAAEIDGASRWEKFRYVTLPQLRPVLLFVVVTSTIGTFRLFSEPLIISEGRVAVGDPDPRGLHLQHRVPAVPARVRERDDGRAGRHRRGPLDRPAPDRR